MATQQGGGVRIKYDASRLLRLAEIAPNETLKAMKEAFYESCQLLQARARQHHRFQSRTGKLESAIDYEVHPAEAEVYVSDSVAPYWKYVHQGTRKHDIFPKNKKMLRFLTSAGTAFQRSAPYQRFHVGGFTFAKGVTHPGTKPDRFLTEAGEWGRPRVNAIFDKKIDRLTRRLSR